LGNVLILAREEVVAALLGLMVELSGFQPRFAEKDQSAEEMFGDGSIRTVLLDCDHPELSETLVETIRSSGARPVLFSPSRLHSEVSRLANRYGLESFTLPTAPDTFSRILGA
jgi:DNA-binding response OmpR family regulator